MVSSSIAMCSRLADTPGGVLLRVLAAPPARGIATIWWKNLAFFDDMLACVAEQFAIDENCVSSAGVSAGALFTAQLGSARGDQGEGGPRRPIRPAHNHR
jgi:hypothetical protein